MATWATRVKIQNVPNVWPACIAHIDAALEYAGGEMDASDVLNLVLRGLFTLWTVIEDQTIVAAATSEIVTYPKCKALRVVTLGGSGINRWFAALDREWEREARRQDCIRIEAVGRKGWGRAVKAYGYADQMNFVMRQVSYG